MTRRILLSLLTATVVASAAMPWNVRDLYTAPKTFDTSHTGEPGVRTVMFEGVPYKGKPTRVFAYYGAPEGAKRAPAMVLVHGGGGTAYAEWVRMWNKRGYAAIAMDTVGTRPKQAEGAKLWNPDRTRDEFSGPAGWGDFANVDLAPEDQWSYHAVAAVVRAHSLLRAFPEVDPKRVGVTGISWGGYLTSMVSGVDTRFRFAAPVYGCGFLGEDSAWVPQFEKMGRDKAGRWLGLWDPSQYLGNARLPMLWVNGTNDFAYPLPSWTKSYRLTRGPRVLAVRVRMKHSHQDGAAPEEIHAFANAILRKGPAPARVTAAGRDGDAAWASFKSKGTIARAELNFTKDGGKWTERKWESTVAKVSRGRARAKVPEGAKAWYLNLFDTEGRVVSAEPNLGE